MNFLVAINPVPLSPTATPTFSPVAGNYGAAQTVSISCSTAGSSIYYTTDGSTPTFPITGTTQLYSTAITVSVAETLKAIATASGFTQSSVGSAAFAFPQVATPTFSPVAGTYAAAQTVTISCSTSGSTIRYTIDGSTPTTSSNLYSTAITVSFTETLKALATAPANVNSSIGTSNYTISSTWNPPSPRLWSMRFPGSGGTTYTYAPYKAWVANNALTGIGINFAGTAVTNFGGTGRGSWVDAAHSASKVPGGSKIVQYLDTPLYNGTNPTPPGGGDTVHGVLYSHIDTNNWLLRVTGTSGATCLFFGAYWVTNISTYVPVDSSGDQFGTFLAKYAYQWSKAGSGPYQSGFSASDAAPNLDGWYWDDTWYTAGTHGTAGSIARDGTTDSGAVATNSGSAADIRANNWRAGTKKIFDQLEIDAPGSLRVVNADYYSQIAQHGTANNNPAIIGAMNQVLDCPQMQYFFGWGFTEGDISFANMVKYYQLYSNMCRPGIKAPLLDIAFLTGYGSTAFGSSGNGIPGSAPLTWTDDQPASYTAAYVGMRYYTAFTNIIGNGMIGCDGFGADVNVSLQNFDEWGNFGSAGFPPGFAGDLNHVNTDAPQTAAKYANGIWERRIYNPTTGKYGRWVMNPRGNGAQVYIPGINLTKGTGSQNPSYNNGATFTSLAMASPDGGFFFE